jgi:hypothetical protein
MNVASWEVLQGEETTTIKLFEEVNGRRCEVFVHTCPNSVHVDATDEGRETARRSLMGRCARMMRLEKLGAPAQILEGEEKLVAKAVAAMRPRDVAQAMHDFPGFVARVERAMKEIEDEHPVDDGLDDPLLDPDMPVEEVDNQLREMGLDPEKLEADGIQFMKTLICADCEATKPRVHMSKCDGAHRCDTADGALRCVKWAGHYSRKTSPHVMG